MAKKDNNIAVELKDKKAKLQALTNTLGQIEKNFGKGAVMRLGAKPAVNLDVIPTGAMTLDVALGVFGVPRGRIVEIYGPEASGKTTLSMSICAQAQKKVVLQLSLMRSML